MRRARFLFWLDIILLLAFALLEEPAPTGLPAHEWLGIGLILLIGLHLLVNWRWITNALSRLATNTRRARVNATLNAALFVSMVFTIFSGLMVSDVALPPFGFQPSTLRVWHQLHSFIGDLTLGIVGLHVAMNWDWIWNVTRKLWAHRFRLEVHGTRTLAQRLGIEDPGALLSRSVRLLGAAVAVSVVSLLLIEAAARARQPRRAERQWATPDLGEAPGEVGAQLLIIAGVALVGRKVLRLKL